jgi:hypothetical protein
MFYEITELKENFLYVRWSPKETPKSQPQARYIADLRSRFDAAKQPIYVLSDLRFGKITDVHLLQQLGKLTYHPNFGGGTAFTADVSAMLYVGVFLRFAAHTKREDGLHTTLAEALAYIESLKAGLTEGIDWEKVTACAAD